MPAHAWWDRRVGHERFLQPLAAFGRFDQGEAVLEGGLVGDHLSVEWGMEFGGKIAVDQGTPGCARPSTVPNSVQSGSVPWCNAMPSCWGVAPRH